MNRIRTIALVLTLVCMVLCPFQADAAQGRAVSLKMIEKVLKDGTSKYSLTLCGITRVSGFVIDPQSKDIIMVGTVDPSYPSLHIDDFMVALRVANRQYTRREGNMLYYSPPGCSIDPDPKTIRQLQQVGSRRGISGQGRQALTDEWEAIGRQPQKVRVMGVPFDTRFAKVMVDADYYMKRLSNGSVELDIPGFKSLMSMRVEETERDFQSGKELSQRESSLNRFWFCPDETTYEESDGAVMLRECRVKLLTEEEFLTVRGEVKGLGRPSVYASRFAEAFTTHYEAIAEARPIYRELESLFRFYAIAKLMRDTNAMSASGNKLAYLLSEHKVKSVPVSRAVVGQTRVIELSDERETDYGYVVKQVMLMSYGGVDMDVRPKKITTAPTVRNGGTARPSTASVRKVVLSSRKSPSEVYWDFAIPD